MAATTSDTNDAAVKVRVAPLLALSDAARSISLHRGRVRAKQNSMLLSRFRGRGMEYDESRIYQPGDDIRHIDWRVTARTGKTHTKMFREERERPLFLCVDLRYTMRFATKNKFKSVIAAECAVLLAWSASAEGDKVGGLIFGDRGHSELKPVRGKNGPLHLIHRLVQADEDAAPADGDDKAGGLDEALNALAHIVHTGSLVFVISDMHDLDENAVAQLAQIGRRAELTLVHVPDPLEESLPPPDHYAVCEGDDYMIFNSGDRAFAESYSERAHQRRKRIEALANLRRMRFIRCPADTDAIISLRRYLGK